MPLAITTASITWNKLPCILLDLQSAKHRLDCPASCSNHSQESLDQIWSALVTVCIISIEYSASYSNHSQNNNGYTTLRRTLASACITSTHCSLSSTTRSVLGLVGRCQNTVTGYISKSELQLPSQRGSTSKCLSKSVPGLHKPPRWPSG